MTVVACFNENTFPHVNGVRTLWIEPTRPCERECLPDSSSLLPKVMSGAPVDRPTTSYWQAEASDSSIHHHGCSDPLPNALAEAVDVVVIGSGISGAVTAHSLLRRDNLDEGASDSICSAPSIIMLEARQACSGATGRNGGHCRPDCFAGFDSYTKIVGKEQARKILQNEWDTFQYIKHLCQSLPSLQAADFWDGYTLGVYLSPDVKQSSKATFDRYREYAGKLVDGVRFIDDAQEAQQISRVPDAVGAAIWPAGSLHPLRFVHGLLEDCLRHENFRLYTHTPVECIAKVDDGHWHVHTSKGSLRAKNIILATNGYSAKLIPSLQEFILPHRAQCSAIRPVQNYMGAKSLATTASIIRRPGNYEYLTQRPCKGGRNAPNRLDHLADGIWILGGGHSVVPSAEQVDTLDDSFLDERITKHLQMYPSKTFKHWDQDGKASLEYVWTGIQGYTRDSLPLVGPHYEQSHQGLYLNVGHHGHGMARAATCSRGLARLMKQEWLHGSTQGWDNNSWEKLAGIPSSYRWTKERACRTDIDCRHDV